MRYLRTLVFRSPAPCWRGAAALLGLVLTLSSASAAAQECRLQQLAGRVARIDGPETSVILKREGRQWVVQRGTCIEFGDLLDASKVGKVVVQTASGERTFGREGEAQVWAPRDNSPDASRFWDELNRKYRDITARRTPIPAVGRGGNGSSGCAGSSGLDDILRKPAAIEPLAALHGTTQRVEANLPELVAAWKPVAGSIDVELKLLGPDGRVHLRRRACSGNSVRLPWGSGAAKAGERLTLRIGDRLEYSIETVTPGTFERPAESRARNWSYGAWLLAFGPENGRLNALGWIASDANSSSGAAAILAAVLSEGFNP